MGTYRETSLHATRQVTLSHSRLSSAGLKSEISVRELISTDLHHAVLCNFFAESQKFLNDFKNYTVVESGV